MNERAKTNFFWQAFFALSLFFTMAGFLGVFAIPNLGMFDLVDFVFSVTAFVGLYGLVFGQPVGKIIFWRYFCYALIAETLVFCLLLPIFGVKRYGQDFALNGFYAFEWAYAIVMVRAQQLYAYRSPQIWRRQTYHR